MNKSESIILETVDKKVWKDLRITDIHINSNHWHLTLESSVHNKVLNSILFIYDELKFNKSWYISIRVKNKCLLDSLKKSNPVFIFVLDKTKKKIYYSDLQYLARVNYPISSDGTCLIKVYSLYDLDKRATMLIADHIIEYNYNWKSLYASYKKYVSDLNKYKGYLNNHFDISDKDFKLYYNQSVNIFRTLNVVNSKADIDKLLAAYQEVLPLIKRHIEKNDLLEINL